MHHFLIALLCTLTSLCVQARNSIIRHESPLSPEGYPFLLSAPDSSASPKPLIVALHSRSAAGTDLDKVDHYGTIDAIESGLKVDAYVLAPQTAEEQWNPVKIMELVDWAATNYDIDPDRISVIGMSMGGNGAADLAATYPDRISAAIVLGGALTQGDVANLNQVPLWVIRGMAEKPHAIERTDRMVDTMRSQPDKAPRLVYSKVDGLIHRQHERMLYMSCFYEWLMSHSLQNPNRSVNTTVDITVSMLNEAYINLHLRDDSAAKRRTADR